MENTKSACKNCRFWTVSKFVAVPYSDETCGECHRNAPRAVTLSCHDTTHSIQWIETFGGDWCGEWEVKLQVMENVRALRLRWGEHDRDGSTHTEWHAPCGCAYHPEPTPHVHACAEHAEVKSGG
jgi:hypothetical protein